MKELKEALYLKIVEGKAVWRLRVNKDCSDYVEVAPGMQIAVPKPNWWHQFWINVFFGWKWIKEEK